jgi:hypothetical protein
MGAQTGQRKKPVSERGVKRKSKAFHNGHMKSNTGLPMDTMQLQETNDFKNKNSKANIRSPRA